MRKARTPHTRSILQSQGFYLGYAFILPTSLTYILPMPEASCLESLMRNRQYHSATEGKDGTTPAFCH